MTDQPVLILLTSTIRDGREQEVDALMNEILPVTRKHEGCLRIDAHRKADGSRRFLIAEHWASLDHYKAYVAWRQSTGDLDRLLALMDAPPQADVWPAGAIG